MLHPYLRLYALLWCLLIWVISSCSDGSLVERPIEPLSPTELASREVGLFEGELDGLLRQRADQLLVPLTLESALGSSELVQQADEPFRSILVDIYRQRAGTPVLVVAWELTDRGRDIRGAIDSAWVHGLLPRDYWADTANAALADLTTSQSAVASFTGITLSPEDESSLVSYLASHPAFREMDTALLHQQLLDALLGNEPNAQEVALEAGAHASAYLEAQVTRQRAAIDLELALALGFLRYAYDLKYLNPVWFEGMYNDDPEELDALVRQALANSFLAGVGPEGFAAVIEQLQPPFEQYGRLLDAHRRYREFARQGGWESVTFAEIRPGREYDLIPALRRRLSAEGYFEGDLQSREYDTELSEALMHYQHTHQFDDNGELSESLVRSLNVPAQRRAQQIALTLQKWRESQIGNDAHFVLINIPDFHVEVWREGTRQMRFRSIVGSTDTRYDRELRQSVFYRATPEVHRSLRYVVFNPYWNVPQDIMINEYDPNLRDDPLWYENNGYEVMYEPDGSRWVRQLPGPDNALGVVKFLFPNPFDVYMHDTPTKSLFRQPFRAFSHGCIRVQDPLEFAEYLLGNDRGWTRSRIDQERSSGQETWVTLRNPIPVHAEYYVVRVDDEGHANFLSDLYRRDQSRFENLVAREMNAVIEEATRWLRIGLETARNCLAGLSASEPCARREAIAPPAEESQLR